MSCLGRERMFDFVSQTGNEKVVHIRLNYSVELRYGVLYDIASQVWNGEPVDVTTGFANVIWQGDASSQIIRSVELASSPPAILNVTGPETFSVRQVALKFGELLGKEVQITGDENGLAYINNATRANELFGYPAVPLGKVIDWTAHWIKSGGTGLGKPTHFETQDGHY
jgi:nucleoside-diphosphate-sugar epimerase